MTPMGLAPDAAASCTPNTPSPPEAPHTSTWSPGFMICGAWPNGIRPGDMEWILMHVERRYRNAETGPDSVVIDAAGHDVNQHLVLADLPGRQHFQLHRAFRGTVAFLADGPGMHLCRNVAERRNF